MKRKMVYAGTAWAAGLALAALSGCPAVILAAALSSALVFRFIFRFELKAVIFMSAVFIAAFGFYTLSDTIFYQNVISYAGKEINYTGTVSDFRDLEKNKSVYYLNGKINGRTKAKIILYNESLICETGDVMSFKCTPKLPVNNYLFSSLDYYKSKGIYLCADSAENINVKNSGLPPEKLLYIYKTKVCSVIKNSVSRNESGMLTGMLFGDKSDIDDDSTAMLYRTGIGHVTAVSGLHLVLFSSLISFILNKLKFGKLLQLEISEILMLLFVLCCGASVSVIRAFIMMTLVNLAPMFFRRSDCLNSVCIAFILITLFNPFAVTNQSLLLSVSGALGAGVFAPFMTSGMKTDTPFRKHFKNLVFLMCISLTVTPASIICFGEASLISPISNLIITPLCMAAVLISIIASLLIFSEPGFLFKTAGALCRIVLKISEITGKSRFTHITLSGDFIPVIISVLIVFCVSSYFIFKSRKYCLLSITISIAVFFNSVSFYNIAGSKTLKIAVLGKNTPGVIVISKGQTADIIDINGNYQNSRYAAKYINDAGISKINNIIITSLPDSAMASYNDPIRFFKTDNVFLPEGTYLLENTHICGCIPKYYNKEWSADYGEYRISSAESNACADYGGFHFDSDGVDYPVNSVIYASDNGKYKLRRLENG